VALASWLAQANTLFTLALVAVAGGYYWVRFKSARDTTGTGAALPSHVPLAARVDQARLRALLQEDDNQPVGSHSQSQSQLGAGGAAVPSVPTPHADGAQLR
jgi:hypothetical protein